MNGVRAGFLQPDTATFTVGFTLAPFCPLIAVSMDKGFLVQRPELAARIERLPSGRTRSKRRIGTSGSALNVVEVTFSGAQTGRAAGQLLVGSPVKLPGVIRRSRTLARRGYDARAMAEPDPPVPILTALIELAEVQLTEAWAEARDQNTYALALAALGVAVIGIIAAIQGPLGHRWWVPIPGLAVTSIVALFGTRRARARLGPDPASFYEAFGTTRTQDALAQLLANLMDARTDVPLALRRQRIALLAVAGLFAITAAYSTLLLV